MEATALGSFVAVLHPSAMGKGARNRANRGQRSSEAAAVALRRDAIGELVLVEDFDIFESLLERRPELLSTKLAQELRGLAGVPGYGTMFAWMLSLLEAAETDPGAAWTAYMNSRAEGARLGKRVNELENEIRSANDARDFRRVLELIELALPLAMQAGLGLTVCELFDQRGLAFCNVSTVRRDLELEVAIEAFQHGVELAVAGEQRARLLMHLGLAYGERVRGDRSENVAHAVEAMRAGLKELSTSDDPELTAMIETNLSVALGRSEGGDRVAVLREAAGLCRRALTFRTPLRNAENWAYSQLNLGYALQDLASLDDVAVDEARAAYLEVIDQADAMPNSWLVGEAHHALGRLELGVARQSPEEILAAHQAGELDDSADKIQALAAARGHLETARDLTVDSPDRLRYGQILEQLSDALAQLGDDDGAIDVAREALTIVRPTTAPEACLNVARRLGELLGARGQWEGAARAYRDAVEAADLLFHARLDTTSREAEVRRTGNLHRWAAFALARAGDAAEAALVLDGSRGREIRRRLSLQDLEEETLAEVPATLRDEYRAALHGLVASPLDGASAESSRRLQRAVTAIRGIAGLDHFGTGSRWQDVVTALEPGRPLVYVNPTPLGTLLLCLFMQGDDAAAEATFLDQPTSTEVYMRLIVGDAAIFEAAIESDSVGSYLIGISGQGTADLKAGIDQALAWLGEALARPLRALLAHHEASGATLVHCGPVGLAPLHAAPWVQENATQCLADFFDVRYAPSAVICAAAHRRAAESDHIPARLVALADPSGDLPAAHREVEEIATLFPSGTSVLAIGARADRDFLRRHARRATHLHLACHAAGGLFDATEAAILLASGPLAVSDVTGLGGLATRLVVVSACQSAQVSVAGLPEEVLSIATAMLASGSACAIASLWPVDDLATATLMTRLYTEILVHGQRPPEALRRAQIWLRDLTEDQESVFLNLHPALAAEFHRRVVAGNPPGRRGPAHGPQHHHTGPYSHPDYWAPFIAVGV
jgi:CHAT domain-containing protein/tetratricopeptide (TPR) repeat protein